MLRVLRILTHLIPTTDPSEWGISFIICYIDEKMETPRTSNLPNVASQLLTQVGIKGDLLIPEPRHIGVPHL